MRAHTTAAQPAHAAQGARAAARGYDAEALRTREREAERVARRAAEPGAQHGAFALSSRAPGETSGATGNAVDGAGRALAPAERAPFEAQMGRDFSRVRVHTDAQAAAAAEHANANAFTRGEHVVFGAGQFRPDTPAGQSLLAHELAHVAQQQGAGAENGVVQCQPKDEQKRGIGSEPPSEPFTVTKGVGPEDDFVLFDQDSALIPVGTYKKAEGLFGKYTTPVTVEIHGYASVEGDEDYNINLSAHRAVAIRHLFRAYLPPDSQVLVYAHGEIDKFGSAAKNRRVGVKVTAGVAPAAKEKPTAPTADDAQQGLSRLPDLNLKKPSLFDTPSFRLPPLTPPLTPQSTTTPARTPQQPPPAPTSPLLAPKPGPLLQPPLVGGPFFNPVPVIQDPTALMNWKDLSAPFVFRGLRIQARDYTSIQQMWLNTYTLMTTQFGLSSKRAAWIANLGTSAAYDIWLAREAPTLMDRTNREMSEFQKQYQPQGFTLNPITILSKDF